MIDIIYNSTQTMADEVYALDICGSDGIRSRVAVAVASLDECDVSKYLSG